MVLNVFVDLSLDQLTTYLIPYSEAILKILSVDSYGKLKANSDSSSKTV